MHTTSSLTTDFTLTMHSKSSHSLELPVCSAQVLHKEHSSPSGCPPPLLYENRTGSSWIKARDLLHDNSLKIKIKTDTKTHFSPHSLQYSQKRGSNGEFIQNRLQMEDLTEREDRATVTFNK